MGGAANRIKPPGKYVSFCTMSKFLCQSGELRPLLQWLVLFRMVVRRSDSCFLAPSLLPFHFPEREACRVLWHLINWDIGKIDLGTVKSKTVKGLPTRAVLWVRLQPVPQLPTNTAPGLYPYRRAIRAYPNLFPESNQKPGSIFGFDD
ncbi:hypothetical protein LZ31DRAFT_369789 [Colletotrichum somersetense]|nr:hypothetical protein LZ31DRAFT_369789 [Colletotrichum somersetense]